MCGGTRVLRCCCCCCSELTNCQSWNTDGRSFAHSLVRRGQAIRNAQEHESIVVPVGVYEECITITKPVEIIGDGVGGERPVIHARGRNALVFRASSGVVRNLTMRQVGAGNVR